METVKSLVDQGADITIEKENGVTFMLRVDYNDFHFSCYLNQPKLINVDF